jgi:hypothetical protein
MADILAIPNSQLAMHETGRRELPLSAKKRMEVLQGFLYNLEPAKDVSQPGAFSENEKASWQLKKKKIEARLKRLDWELKKLSIKIKALQTFEKLRPLIAHKHFEQIDELSQQGLKLNLRKGSKAMAINQKKVREKQVEWAAWLGKAACIDGFETNPIW